MTNHPNRSRRSNPAANPTPAQIRAWRIAAGLTQRRAGELAYTTERQWQRWESGETRMLRAVFACARYRLGELLRGELLQGEPR